MLCLLTNNPPPNYSKQSVCHFVPRSMAKWLKDYLNFGTRRDPPQPPRPDYSESEILRAYRAQKELDFEDPYQHSDKEHQNGGFSPCSATVSLPSFPAFGSVLPNGVEVRRACLYRHIKDVFIVSVDSCNVSSMCFLPGESGVTQTQTDQSGLSGVWPL